MGVGKARIFRRPSVEDGRSTPCHVTGQSSRIDPGAAVPCPGHFIPSGIAAATVDILAFGLAREAERQFNFK
jgi:hypothetical protein